LASNLGLVRPRFVSCQLRSTSVSYTYGVPSSAVHPVGCAACVSGDRARRRRDVSFFGRGQEEFGHSANPSGGDHRPVGFTESILAAWSRKPSGCFQQSAINAPPPADRTVATRSRKVTGG